MAAPNKQRVLAKLLNLAAKAPAAQFPESFSVLDHLLFAVVQEGTSHEAALPVYQSLVAGFHDFNEMRVSHPLELEELLEPLPGKEPKARRILNILQFIFETTYAFDLESMRKKPLKQAQKQLSKISGTTSFVVAAVVQRALGGHALPIDPVIQDLLVKMALVEPELELEAVRTAMEHMVPKTAGPGFTVLMGMMSAEPARLGQIVDVSKSKARPKEAKEKPSKSAPARSAAPRKTSEPRKGSKDKK